jgi:hypothetical protein
LFHVEHSNPLFGRELDFARGRWLGLLLAGNPIHISTGLCVKVSLFHMKPPVALKALLFIAITSIAQRALRPRQGDSHVDLFHVEHVCGSKTRVQWGTRYRREGAFSRETGPGRVYLPALVSAVSRAPFAVNMSPGPMCSTWNTPSLRHEQGPAHRMRPCCLPVIY